MSEPLGETLLRQFDTAWALASHHLDGLTTEECLWRPTSRGPHVTRTDDGTWAADLDIDETYGAGLPSIAWITWHMLMWWSLAIDGNFGGGALRREEVRWPGSAEAVQAELQRLAGEWREKLSAFADRQLLDGQARWPFHDRNLAGLFAWANVELTKNAAELGFARFLKGASEA